MPPCEVWCPVVKGVKATGQLCAGGGLDTLEEYRISACLRCLIAVCVTGRALGRAHMVRPVDEQCDKNVAARYLTARMCLAVVRFAIIPDWRID